MNVSKFEGGNCFSLLDLEACLRFKTETSASFAVGKYSRNRVGFVQRGWLDVHHPANDEGWPKAFLSVSLPEKYLQPEQQQQIIRSVFQALDIPEATFYEVDFFSIAKLIRQTG
jgi:hypothetical protein